MTAAVDAAAIEQQQDDNGIPVIDMSQDESAVAAALVEAFTRIGFATLVNHGLSHDNDNNDNTPQQPETTSGGVVDSAWQASKSFFALDLATKMQSKYRSHESNRGYIAMGSEQFASFDQADRKETFDIGKEGEDGDGLETPWPESLPSMKEPLLRYWKAFDALHLKLLKLIAIGLKLDDPNFFVDRCNQEHCNLRLLHYPALDLQQIVPPDSPKDVLVTRGAIHTDYGTITLLVQDDVGGLRAQRRNGTWTFVPPVQHSIVVNVGDMLERWTNDVLRATPHQVVVPPALQAQTHIIPERYSIAFFCNANKDVTLDVLEAVSDEPPKYESVNALDYLTGRLSATISK